MNSTQIKKDKRARRHAKIRSTIAGTAEKPRLSVYKSNKYVYAQIIDDDKSHTLAAFSSLDLKDGKGTQGEKAKQVGIELAKIAKEKAIGKVVFDRGGFLYRGLIKAIADGAREGGLIF
jgi:large subunit ribosomal protein L18